MGLNKMQSFAKYKTELIFIASSAILLMCGMCSLVLSSLTGVEQGLLSSPSTIFIANQEEFSCGGGPFSFYMASLISTSCDRSKIHNCCAAHDICYDSLHLNQSYCDEYFVVAWLTYRPARIVRE
uniref:Uncharacterized protein n=1 Tax=Ditylenchus dipsaci TaxID=166011 RepID=A0A915E1V2_9BILA